MTKLLWSENGGSAAVAKVAGSRWFRKGAGRGGWLGAILGLIGAVAPLQGAVAPKMVSSQPANGATGVAPTSAIQFVFDLAMMPNTELGGIPGLFPGALKWSANVTADDFSYGWSEDNKTLTCTYEGELPANATVTWQLNPPDVFDALALQSMEGAPLAKGTYSGSFTTGEGGGGEEPGAPTLVSSHPAQGATGVPVTASVVFVFDQAMKPNPLLGGFPPFVKGAIEWTGTGLVASRFTYSWSTDQKTLTCDYSGDLPGETVIGWILNPAGTELPLESENGEPLPSGTYQGSFTTGVGGGGGNECDPDGIPDDWGTYNLVKSASYVQSSTADPVPLSEDAFGYSAFVQGPDAGPAVSAASLTLPSGSVTNLEGFPFGGMFFLAGSYTNETALDAALPAGGYTLRFQQGTGVERVIPMNLPANTIPVPKIANFADAQAINPEADFTLRWNAFTGASAANDLISLSIIDRTNTVFHAPDPCVPRALAVTDTSIVVPRGILAPGKTYEAFLTFVRGFYSSTNAVPSMAGFGSISRSTQFTVRTTGGASQADPARFVGYRTLPNGNPELTLTGTAGRTYTVQRAGNLSSPGWVAAGAVTMDAAGRAVLEDTTAGALRPVFYRAVAN